MIVCSARPPRKRVSGWVECFGGLRCGPLVRHVGCPGEFRPLILALSDMYFDCAPQSGDGVGADKLLAAAASRRPALEQTASLL
jgi:hypothetical protein